MSETQNTPTRLTPEQYEKIERTMNPQVRIKIATRFVEALDAGHDLYDSTTNTSPAGEVVMAAMVAEARELGWDETTIRMMRWNVRALGRRVILDTLAAAL